MKPTNEQQKIIEAAKDGQNLAISAFAGTGKTSTLIFLSKELLKPSIYVAFNKSIATEASKRFPSHVDCKTMHSIAWQSIVKGTGFRKKLQGFLDRKDILRLFPELNDLSPELKYSFVNKILQGITIFCASNSFDIADFMYGFESPEYDVVSDYIEDYWNVLIDPDSSVKISHDIYLKLFQLSKPDLGYPLIYGDEVQDLNPVMSDIILRQKGQKVLIGDAFQSIYAWRGAKNTFDLLSANYKTLNLTESFRFTPEIAEKANTVLNILGADSKVKGLAEAKTPQTKAYLVRTNLDLFEKLVYCYEQGYKAYVIGDLKDLFSKLYTAKNLQCNGDPSKRYDKQIASYSSWDEFCKDVEHTPGLAKITSILNNHHDIHGIITKIKSIITKEPAYADLIISTAHKSKGLEWDEVTLEPGFLSAKDIELFAEDKEAFFADFIESQTGNLVYVSITRAKYKVNLPEELKIILEV